MDSYEIVGKAVREFWKKTHPQDVFAFFYQKYDFESDAEWEWCEELIECKSDIDYDSVCFQYDFCEGQTCVKDLEIVPQWDVSRYFTEHVLNKNCTAVCSIPLKLPSLNEYINACRKNAYAGAKMKKQTQEDIMWFVKKLPKFDKPINIHFHWVEGNRKRDYDNIASAKKFILDAMVKCGKLKDDNRNYVMGFSDTFGYEKGVWKVILEIEEQDE